MRTYLFIRRTALAASLMLIPWVPALSTYAADPSQGVGTPSQEIPKTIRDAQPSFPSDAPVVGVAPAQANGIFFPRSGPEAYGTTVPRSWSEQSKEMYSAPSGRPHIPSIPYFPSLGRDG